MELGLFLIFWYGVLHAFGPDHLTAIADFSIGKSKKKTMIITFLFVLGHGLSLYIFALILQNYVISDDILAYGDMISSFVIFTMGLFLLYMVYTDRIQLKKHVHEGKEHMHIWFGKEHSHGNNTDTASALTISILMGIGGVRGMLITLGVVGGATVDFTMVIMFALGVMVIFMLFGLVILYINQNLLHNKQNIRRVFTTAGVISLVVGGNMFLG